MYDLDACRMAGRCRTTDKLGEGGPANGRGLCDPDERHSRHVIGQLADDWTLLQDLVGKDAGRNGMGGSMGRGGKTAPIPMNLHVDAAAREVAWMLDVWAAAVHERIAVAEEGRRRDFAERGVRQSWAVARSARILRVHYPVLLALRPTPYMPYGDDHLEPAEDDGPGAIVGLIDLHYRARAVIGETKRLERRDLPCPAAPIGCGLDGALVREIGEERVHCTYCGWWCTTAEYDHYALTYLPPRAVERMYRDATR